MTSEDATSRYVVLHGNRSHTRTLNELYFVFEISASMFHKKSKFSTEALKSFARFTSHWNIGYRMQWKIVLIDHMIQVLCQGKEFKLSAHNDTSFSYPLFNRKSECTR